MSKFKILHKEQKEWYMGTDGIIHAIPPKKTALIEEIQEEAIPSPHLREDSKDIISSENENTHKLKDKISITSRIKFFFKK